MFSALTLLLGSTSQLGLNFNRQGGGVNLFQPPGKSIAKPNPPHQYPSMITKQDLISGNIIGYFQLPSKALAEANPDAYNNAICSLPSGSGCCQYCGRPIVHHIVVQLANRRKVFIGTDCAEKVGHNPEDIRRVITAEERAAAKDKDGGSG